MLRRGDGGRHKNLSRIIVAKVKEDGFFRKNAESWQKRGSCEEWTGGKMYYPGGREGGGILPVRPLGR